MGSRLTARACERTRSYTSLELDGQLSELERVHLSAHLVRCRACRRYRSDVRAITHLLRTTPAELPEQRPIRFPARPARLPQLRLGAAASFAVALLGTATFVTPTLDSGSGGDDGASTPALTDELPPLIPGAEPNTQRGALFNFVF